MRENSSPTSAWQRNVHLNASTKKPYLNSTLNCIQLRVFLLRQRNTPNWICRVFAFGTCSVHRLLRQGLETSPCIRLHLFLAHMSWPIPSLSAFIQIPQSSRNSLSSLPTFVPIVRETLWSYRLEHCTRYTRSFSSQPNMPLASPPENSAIPIFF